MSKILISGLSGSNPLGALAAFGLLRCCEGLPAAGPSRLSWEKGADWFPVLTTDKPLAAEGLVAALADRQGGRATGPELHWADTIKTSPEKFQAAARQALGEAAAGRREFADFLAAFACDLATGEDGELEPTAFYMTSGRQEFLKEARGLCGKLVSGISLNRRAKAPQELFREALFGPWKYEDPQHSLGWDPTTERLHALRGKSPTKEASWGVAGAVWLAFEALPLFPCLLSGGRLVTRGFRQEGRVKFFTWPVWTEPASLATVRSLLALEELTRDQPPMRELRGRGVAAVFRSERYKVKTQGNYHIFRPAAPCV
jgi:hypothetical protein